MQYVNFRGDKLSRLGFGAMRLPLTTDNDADIDEEAVYDLLQRLFEGGVNYIDTAYAYHLWQSEVVLGRCLKRFPRDSYYLADKFPGHEVRKTWDPEAIFEEQLTKTGHEYFDYYLLHNVCEGSLGVYLDEQWGIVDYIMQQKKAGRVRHVGFSTHGSLDVVTRFLDAYGDQMEFCQIEMNYVDWTLQNAKALYELLIERGIAVWVMEPVRGGALASLPSEFEAEMKRLRPDESIASWAFRWLMDMPDVAVILSGMSNEEQVLDNLKTFSDNRPLSAEERALLDRVVDELLDMVPCTACRYCCGHCPQELDIPKLISLANELRFKATVNIGMRIDGMDEGKRPAACLNCGECTKMCPQGINIPEVLAELDEGYQKLPKWADLRSYD